MQLSQITTWMDQITSRPATPEGVAAALNGCTDATASMVQLGRLRETLVRRFYNERRRQLTEKQVAAAREAIAFGHSGGAQAGAFPQLSRAQLTMQMLARVLDPSLVQQGNTLLCGPAAVAICLASARPVEYVRTCVALATRGQATLGTLQLQARQDLRNYAQGDPERIPAADWVLLASLRNAPRASLTDNTGSDGEDIFNWMKGGGFASALLVMNYPLKTVRMHPAQLVPSVDTSNRAAIAREMCELTTRGWRVVMLAFGDIARAAQVLASSAQQVRDFSYEDTSAPAGQAYALMEGLQRNHEQMQRTQEGLLGQPTPSVLRLAWNVLWGNSAAHTLHATYVHRASIEGDKVRLSCSNWGKGARWVDIPFDAFANRVCGFAAVMD